MDKLRSASWSSRGTASELSVDSEKGKTKEQHGKAGGLGWFVTALFVVGDLAGGGVVALPTAVVRAGLVPGILMMIAMACMATFTSHVLGQSWNALMERWPEYREHTRKPYAEIGYRALGARMRTTVSIVTNITNFMVAVVYLELASQMIESLLKSVLNISIPFCVIMLVLGISLLPLTFLKSPSDFWWAVVIAMFTTTCAVILIIIGASRDFGTCSLVAEYPDAKPTNYFLALGTFLFAVGGHQAFPTIQHDMKQPQLFTRSSIIAFSIMLCMYVPTGIVGYVTYGDAIRESIIPSIQHPSLQQAINVLIMLHLVLALTIVFNPVNQELEEIFSVPHHFCIQRVAVRSAVMGAVILVAETLPSFEPLLNLIGGSTQTLACIVFPCAFHLFLEARRRKEEALERDDGPVTVREMLRYNDVGVVAVCGLVILLGLLGGGAASFSAIRDLFSAHFKAPCYVQPFLAAEEQPSNATLLSSTFCCGTFQNVSTSADLICRPPHPDFY